MKQIIFLLLMAAAGTANAQFNSDMTRGGAVKAGIAYVHDFPGVNGPGAFVEYSFPLNEWLQGGIGIRRVQTGGYPRTQTVHEYTKATALDFNLLFSPVHTDKFALRIGSGYSFSFYNIRRSYPVYVKSANSSAETVQWPQSDEKGKAHGISLLAEYEYYFNDNFSAGARVSVCKAYGNVVMGGPFVTIKL